MPENGNTRVHCGFWSLSVVLPIRFLTRSDGHRLSVTLLLKLTCFPGSRQEALEVRKPQFISRSQERLKRLERMIQQRRAQRKESPGPKQGPLPVHASKKQFTVPHPLSGELDGRGAGGYTRLDPAPPGLVSMLPLVYTGPVFTPSPEPSVSQTGPGSRPISGDSL